MSEPLSDGTWCAYRGRQAQRDRRRWMLEAQVGLLRAAEAQVIELRKKLAWQIHEMGEAT